MNLINESKIDVYVCRLASRPSPLIELRLHPRQFQVFHSPKRFCVLVAGRRFGKTELALAELTRAAESTPNRTVWYVAPSEKPAKRIVWHRLKKITRNIWPSLSAPPKAATISTNRTSALRTSALLSPVPPFKKQTRRPNCEQFCGAGVHGRLAVAFRRCSG